MSIKARSIGSETDPNADFPAVAYIQEDIIAEILAERERQDKRWGERQKHYNGKPFYQA